MAYSIGKSTRQDIGKNNKSYDLGPGAYNNTSLVNRKSEPQWSMAGRTQENMNKTMAPGPQQYVIPSKIVEHPSYSMGVRTKNDHMNQTIDIPGPGQYSPDVKDKKFAFTMGARYKVMDQTMKEGLPGPGTYELKKQSSIISVKFGTGNRETIDQKRLKSVPGPGEYTGAYQNVTKSAPKFKFGTGERTDSLDKLKKFIPGPGTYDSKNVIGMDSVSKTMGSKASLNSIEKENKSKPGPGQYDPNPENVLKNSPYTKIGTSLRQDAGQRKEQLSKPPPGNYNPTDKFTKTQSSAWGFGTASRPAIGETKVEVPGPNSYSIPSKISEGPKYLMGAKSIIENKEQKPGPGSYEFVGSHSRLKSDPSFSMGTGQREGLVSYKQKQAIPGPGNYSVLNENVLKKQSPQYRFGTEKRQSQDEQGSTKLLGPGAYANQTFVGFEGRKQSLSPKLRDVHTEKESRNKPGPGQYDVQGQSTSQQKNVPAYKIGTSLRQDVTAKSKSQIPDPAVYEPSDSFTKTKSASFGFGTAQRQALTAAMHQKIPGPGQYELPVKAFDKPRFAMGVKTKDNKKMEVPGPGTYDSLANSKAMPAFSISGKNNIDKNSNTPGPGEYKVPEKVLEGPKFGFGTGTRALDKKSPSPGPGHYKLPTKIANLPSHALQNQNEEFKFV